VHKHVLPRVQHHFADKAIRALLVEMEHAARQARGGS
jgi:hypothetical protein